MKILHLVTSSRGKDSFSNKLGTALIDKLRKVYPDTTVNTHNINQKPFPHLEEVHITSFHTPEAHRTPELIEAVKHSDIAIQGLMDADTIIIDVPMYNFTIPSTLRAWVDHIVRAGKTFKYTENGVEGLIKNKKVYLMIASGGIYSEGMMKDYDFTEKYLKAILGFIGLHDITVFRIEGTAMPEYKENALPKALQAIEAYNLKN